MRWLSRAGSPGCLSRQSLRAPRLIRANLRGEWMIAVDAQMSQRRDDHLLAALELYRAGNTTFVTQIKYRIDLQGVMHSEVRLLLAK